MISLHLTERELQEAAETVAHLPVTLAAHLRACPRCQAQVAGYRRLFTSTAQLPAPAFSFDLSAAVLAQLPRIKLPFPWIIILAALLVLSVIAAFILVFGVALVQAFQGLFTLAGVGLVIIAGFLVAGHCLEMLARHRRRMSQLTFS